MSTLGLVLARFVFRPYGTPRIPSGFQRQSPVKWEETIRGIGPGMGLAVVVAVGAALILPGLGSHGLSDPGKCGKRTALSE